MPDTNADGKVIIEIDADSQKINDALKDVGKEATDAGEKIEDALGKQLLDAITKSTKSIDTLTDATKANTTNIDDLSKSIGQLGDNMEKADDDTNRLKDSLSGMSGIIEHAFGNLLSDAIKGAINGVKDLAQEVYNTGVSFESAFAGVKKTVDETASTSYDDLNNALREMAKNMPAAYEEIAGVAEAAGQLGIATDDITDFTKVMVDLGNSTNLSAEMAASELAKFANVTKMSADDYDKLGSAIVDLGNNMATTEADIVNMSQRLGATASVAGIAQPDILALSAALSSVGVEAEAGGTAMANFIKKMQTAVETGGKNLTEFAEVAGMTEDAFAELFQKNGAEAIDAFIRGLHRIDEEGGSALSTIQEMGFKEVRLSNAILALANNGDILTRSLQIANTAWEENTALTEEAEKRYETTASKMQMLQNEVRDFYYELSQSLAGDFGSFMDLDKTGDILDRIKEKVQEGDLAESLARIADKMLELAEAGVNFAIDEGLPKLIEVLDWISTHGDEIIAILEMLAAKLLADKVGDYAKSIANVVMQFQALGGETAAATTAEAAGAALGGTATAATQAAAAVNAYVLALEAAVIVGTYLAKKIDEAGDALIEYGKYENSFTDEANDALEAYTKLNQEFTENPLAASTKAKENLERDKEALDGYKQKLKEAEEQLAEYYEQAQEGVDVTLDIQNLNAEIEEINRTIQAWESLINVEQKYSDWHDEHGDLIYEPIKPWREQLAEIEKLRRSGEMDETAYWRRKKQILETNRHMEDHDWQKYYDEVTQHYRGLSKTEETAQKALDEELAELETQYSLDKVHGTANEKEYWAKRRAILDAHRNEEDEDWRKLYIEVQEHYDKLTEEEKRAQDKADKEAARQQKQRETEAKREQERLDREKKQAQDKYNRELDNIYKDAKSDTKKELNAVKKDFDEIATEYKKGYDQIIKDRDKYKDKLKGGSIFATTEKTDSKTGEKTKEFSIVDLRKRSKELEAYRKNREKLIERGIDENLLHELEDMKDEEARNVYAKQLANMTDREFNNINSYYKKIDEESTKIANERYQTELDELQKGYIDKTEELFAGMSQDLKDTGLETGAGYLKSVVMGFDDGSDNFKDSMDAMFESIGKELDNDIIDLSDNIRDSLKEQGYGDGIIDGIIDEVNNRRQEVEDTVKDILTQTNIDLDIQNDMQSRSAAQSTAGYSNAKSNDTAEKQSTTQTAAAQGNTIKVELQLTEPGKGVIADIVNAENKKKEIEVNG